MRPITTDKTNFTYILPGGPPESTLPVEKKQENGMVPVNISIWELSADEMIALQMTRKIELAVWGEVHPPVALAVIRA